VLQAPSIITGQILSTALSIILILPSPLHFNSLRSIVTLKLTKKRLVASSSGVTAQLTSDPASPKNLQQLRYAIILLESTPIIDTLPSPSDIGLVSHENAAIIAAALSWASVQLIKRQAENDRDEPDDLE
jgi:hypothetical protein